MPRRVFSFDRPDRFVCGTVGQPGQRTFFLQAAKGDQLVSVALEKAQVAVLAERIAALLVALRQRGVDVPDEIPGPAPELGQPVVEQFRVGAMTLGWNGEAGRVVIEAREIGEDDVLDADAEAQGEADDEDIESAAEADDDDDGDEGSLPSLAADVEDPRDIVRVELEPRAALRFASGAMEVVRAGRPPCPMCGAPLDPTGHFCPRRNGHSAGRLN